MRLVLLYARIQTLALLRFPTFAIPTVSFPVLLFVLFVVPRAERSDANVLMASYTAFGFLAVAFFEFGVGTADERTKPWDRYLRTLPARIRVRFAGRLVTALLFAAVPAVLVIALALALTPVSLTAAQWGALAAVLLLGSVPFGLLGIAIGYLVSPQGALPVANVLFFALAFLGGLFTGPGGIPGALEPLAVILPTGQWAALLEAAVADRVVEPWAWLGLVGWTAALGALAVAAYVRDEGLRYR